MHSYARSSTQLILSYKPSCMGTSQQVYFVNPPSNVTVDILILWSYHGSIAGIPPPPPPPLHNLDYGIPDVNVAGLSSKGQAGQRENKSLIVVKLSLPVVDNNIVPFDAIGALWPFQVELFNSFEYFDLLSFPFYRCLTFEPFQRTPPPNFQCNYGEWLASYCSQKV